jgi:hypothetical protein
MMTRLILGIFAMLVAYSPSQAQQDPDLIRLARLHGVAWLVLEDQEKEDEILKQMLSKIEEGKPIDPNELVERLIPKKPRTAYKIIDTSKYRLNAEPYKIIDDPIYSPANRARLEQALVGKGRSKKISINEAKTIKYENMPGLDELTKLHVFRSFMRAWSGVQFKYPYKEKLPIPWDSVFVEELERFTSDSITNGEVYLQAFKEFAARMNDGHASISDIYVKSDNKKHLKQHREEDREQRKEIRKLKREGIYEKTMEERKKARDEKTYQLYPISLEAYPEGLFVNRIYPSQSTEEISIGDQIETINSKSIDEVINEFSRSNAFSRYAVLMEDMNHLRVWQYLSANDTMVLKIKNKAQEFVIPKEAITGEEYVKYFWSNSVAEQIGKQEVAYFNLGNRHKDEMKKSFEESAKEGIPIIIDAREYPHSMFVIQIPKYLSNKPEPSAILGVEMNHYPGIIKEHGPVSFFFSNNADLIFKSLRLYPTNWNLFYPFANKTEAPVVVLMDENTISWGESTVMAIKAHAKDRVTLIGRNTAGANGDVGLIQIAGKKEFGFTSVVIQDAEGNNYQHRGIPPDIYVEKEIPNPKNYKEDRILQTALDFLRERGKQAVLE